MIVEARAVTTTQRVAAVRDLMRAEGLDAVIVRSTDRYLNEYVPLEESTRAWLTGFTGSMGDALVTLDAAWVVVDGRYYLQGDQELAGTPFAVERVPLGTSIRAALFALVKKVVADGARRVAYEPDRFALKELDELTQALQATGAALVPTQPSLLERARGPIAAPERPVRGVDEAAVGLTVAEKVARTTEALRQHDVQGFVVQHLDELAWVTNLRGGDFPYQATFRGIGVLTPEAVVVALDGARVPAEVLAARGAALRLVDPADWTAALPAGRVGYDPDGVTADVVQAIRARGATPVPVPSPVAALKAKKNPAELKAMRAAFARADAVVEAAQAYVHRRVDAGEPVTEADLAAEVERLFLASGATGLSFKVIAAAGKNGAVIHYGTPDPERVIRAGELVLLDTGAYYAEGYATDLTRTFLAGSHAEATAEQRRYFTLVLKAAVAGMSARLPVGARGDQLDAITRAPLWAAGLDFNHGTGHGVGINVHEFPPRVSPNGAVKLEEGHVFSIEPGVYLPDFGGVRIENLVTLAAAPGAPGFLDVVPLTTSRLDERLFDQALLTEAERAWLARYAAAREV